MPVPVILFLCGGGEYGSDGVHHLLNTFGPQLWDRRSRFPFVVVFPQCRTGWSIGSSDVTSAMGMLDAAIAEFHGDPDRVCLTGVSSGGAGAWVVAAAYPDRFAAVAPLCGSASADVAATLAQAGLPVWNFVNARDNESLVSSNRELYQALVDAGADANFMEVPGERHNCWDHTYRYPGLYDWLLRQSRRKNSSRGRFVRILETVHGRKRGIGAVSRETRTANSGQIDSGVQIRRENEPVSGPRGWSVERDGVWSVDAPGVLLAEGNAADLPARITSERTIEDVELQFDFEFRGDDGFRLGFVAATNGTVDESVESPSAADGHRESHWMGLGLDIVPNISGSGGLIELATGECLQPCDPLGQLMLKSDGWNAFRATLVGGRVTAWLNGWKLIEYPGEGLPTPGRRIAFELIGTGPQRLALPGPAHQNLDINLCD